MANKFKILTPHAAVIIWNFNDRISGTLADEGGVIDEEGINVKLISTVSCVSIQTSKSKGSPAGSFQLTLAPSKNWVSTITSGSWCAILMSNKPITESDIKTANPDQVKMFGKIESVRVDTIMNQDGTRQTRFLVSGTDWGHIFNNVLYIDNLIAAANDPQLIGNGPAIALRNLLLGDNNSPQSFAVKDNLASLVNIFGNNLDGYSKFGDTINRLAKSSYDFILPKEVANFFNFIRPVTNQQDSRVITKLLNIQTGKLTKYNEYKDINESFGYINPFSLQGTNSFWQILLDNSNPALNEMYNEIEWTTSGRPQLTLYNRIKPFSYKTQSNFVELNNLRSPFNFIKTHVIDSVGVISINAGTNWRDKYNFIEVKPQFQEFQILGNWVKTKSQISDESAFNREGFRPMIVGTKQFPVGPTKGTTTAAFDVDQLTSWTKLLSEWYFDTHRLLNGTLVMAGQNEYIAVGNNIRFEAGLINPTPNINAATNQSGVNKYILAHIENVEHSFSVKEDGSREYLTTVQFVRGIIVDKNNKLVGEGSLDQFAEDLSQNAERNTLNTVVASESDDPDKKRSN